MRLSRVGGTVNWAIGIAPEVGTGPTLWIEQDQFIVRKYRGATQATLRLDDYRKYDEGFWHPRSMAYSFGNTSVTVNVLSVKPLGKLTATDNRFKTSSLNEANALRLPDADGLREFYSRFR